jgi:hypothetical protein
MGGDGMVRRPSTVQVLPYSPTTLAVGSYGCEHEVQFAIHPYVAYILNLECFENDVGLWEGTG